MATRRPHPSSPSREARLREGSRSCHSLAASRHQPVEQLRIDIAAGQHRDHDLALHVERPASSAASPIAPPGSTTSFSSRNANATARPTSSSLAVTPSPISLRLIAKVMLARRVRSSARRRSCRSCAHCARACRSERARGVVEALRLGGVDLRVRHARLHARARCRRQARRPRRRSPRCRASARARSRSSTISRPAVPCPAMINGSSYGGTSVAPRFSAISRAMPSRSSLVAVVEHDLGAERRGALALRPAARPTASRSPPACRAASPRAPRPARDCRTKRPPRRRRACPAGSRRACCRRRGT